MNNSILSIRIDEQTKKDLSLLAADFGLTSTTLTKILIKQAIRDQKVVLENSLVPTPYLEELIKVAESDYKNNKNITVLKSKEEVNKFLTDRMKAK